MTPDEEVSNKPNGRVTTRDLLGVVQATNAAIALMSQRVDAQTAHYDAGLGRVSACLESLRNTVNEQLHQFEKRVDEVEKSETARRVMWNIKVALLRGSWKLTTLMVTAVSIITGVIVRWGFPWEWGLFR